MSASETVVKSRYPSYPEPSAQSGPRARLTSTGHSAPSSTVVSVIPSGIVTPVGLGEAVDFSSLIPTCAGFDAASSELLTLIAEHPPSSRLSAAAPAAPVGLGAAVAFSSLVPACAGFAAAASGLLTLLAEHPPSSRLSAAAPATNGLVFIVCLHSLPTVPIMVPTQLAPPSPGGTGVGHIAWCHD